MLLDHGLYCELNPKLRPMHAVMGNKSKQMVSLCRHLVGLVSQGTMACALLIPRILTTIKLKYCSPWFSREDTAEFFGRS